MKHSRGARIGLAVMLVGLLVGGFVVVKNSATAIGKTRITAYFENSIGLYPGDEVRILGVPVGEIESIQPEPLRVKITLWVDSKYKVPAEAKAAVLSPNLVSARFIQLTPVYTAGAVMPDDAVIPQNRTVVPVEFDDLRDQLKKLTDTLQPTQPGGMSTAGRFIDTAANNLRGQGSNIRDTVIKLSQTLSILGDQSDDVFGTVKNLAVLVSALHDSTDIMRELNQNLAAVTGLLANDPDEVGTAVRDLNTAVGDVRSFIADNRETLGTTADKLAEITKALGDSSGDIEQALHVFPTAISNFVNIYEPAQAAVAGALAGNNFANPVQFICGAIQAASRLNAEQSAKLCVQYLAPILKNRQYNFLGPIGFAGTPLLPLLPVGAQARPNEVTYSEDWMRPDYVPPAPATPTPAVEPARLPAEAPAAADGGPATTVAGPLPAAAPTPANSGSTTSVDPAAGLPGMLVPPGAGS